MRVLFFALAVAGTLRGQEVVTENAPPEVIAAAVGAVGALGKEVVMGRYQVAIERMYPQWKERTAKRIGGMDKLEAQLNGVAKQMLQQGISITDFKAVGQPRAFEVYPGTRKSQVNGVEIEELRYTKWLVLVPTLTRFRMIRDGEPRPMTIESEGFQVAISDKGTNDWTFIDGSGATVNELRSLFISLPRDLELPALEKREIR